MESSSSAAWIEYFAGEDYNAEFRDRVMIPFLADSLKGPTHSASLKPSIEDLQPQPHISGFDAIDDLSDVTIGVWPEWFGAAEADVVAACLAQLRRFEERGARVVNVTLPSLEVLNKAHMITILS